MDYVVKGRVRGYVQGVGYRQFIQQLALEKGLVGWAKNLGDGSVEVFLQGKRADVNEVQHKASMGPKAADVCSLSWELLKPIDSAQFMIG